MRKMILAGELRPGDRVVENQLTHQLGVSRPPLREALRVLEHEGLVVQHPRRGSMVTPLTQHDVYEILTLREELERMAVRLGVPVRSAELLRPCRAALDGLHAAAAAGDEGAATSHGFAFHIAVVGLAEHSRLVDAYRRLALQMQLCMVMNRTARKDVETLAGNAERHARLLALIERGDPDPVCTALAEHGHQSFLLTLIDELDGPTARSQDWLTRERPHPSVATASS
jgi:DNA-binding GntR family transcriptional regulator